MNIDKLLSVDLIVSLLALSFCLSGWIMLCMSFMCKISNFTGHKRILVHPNTFLMIFIGSVLFSLSDICLVKWEQFFIQTLVSCLNLSIYIIQRKTYRQRLENENC